MSSRELTESRQRQPLLLQIQREAGQAHDVAVAPQECNRMKVTTEIEPIGAGIRRMAQPPGSERLGRLLNQTLDPAASLMIADDQPQCAAQQLRQGSQLGAQLLGESQPAVNQIAQHHHLLRAMGCRQLQQGIEGAGIAIAGKGNAMGLEGFGLAQVEVGQQQGAAFRIPGSPAGKQLKPVFTPAEGGRPAAQRAPITRW